AGIGPTGATPVDVVVIVLPLSRAAALSAAATSARGSTSASITRSGDLVRSWLRRSRTVSRLASTSSLPPLMKPATSTRWNAVTSIFAWTGSSLGVSCKPAQRTRATPAARAATRTALLAAAALGAVIDFFEEIVVLPDRQVLRI